MDLLDMMKPATRAPIAPVSPEKPAATRDCEPVATLDYLRGDGPTRSDIAASIRTERRGIRRNLENMRAGRSSWSPDDLQRFTDNARQRIASMIDQGRAIPKPARAIMPTPAHIGPYAPGTPAIDRSGARGYVLTCEPETGRIWTIGGNGLERDLWRVTIAWESRVDSYSENIAAPYVARAHYLPACPDLTAWQAEARAAMIKAKAEASRRSEAASAKQADWRAKVATHWPDWAESALVAVLKQDESDSMSDYHGSKQLRAVVLSYSRHTRDLFAEMRKAAALFPETAHLSGAPESAEHREKYSMGAGYYLKTGWRDDSGWHVEKMRRGSVESLWCDAEFLELPDVPTQLQKPVASDGGAGGAMRVEKHVHTKRGFDMWIAVIGERVERERFELLRDAAKDVGGWYSRAWGRTPGGFAFKVEADAIAFASQHGGADHASQAETVQGEARPTPARPTPSAQGLSEKLRAMADGLESDINDKFRDRRANTPKQQKQAASARQDGLDLKRAQVAMRLLADLHDAGTVPAGLASVRTKAAIIDLCGEQLDFSRGGYYSPGLPMGKPRSQKPEAAALWALMAKPIDPEERKREELRQKIEGLKFAKIPGYFPTPAAVIDQMLDYGNLPDGAHVLEPSAGSGNIAEAMRERGHEVQCIERNWTLAEILDAKGFDVTRDDFLTLSPSELGTFDAVMMNPPFEMGQDVKHVLHAWQFVKRGGALVAIMSAGVTFRADRQGFRDWIDENGGELVELPADSFKESGTGVATVLLSLRKD